MHEAGILRCCWTLLVHFPSARSATLRLYPGCAARCRVWVVISIVLPSLFLFPFQRLCPGGVLLTFMCWFPVRSVPCWDGRCTKRKPHRSSRRRRAGTPRLIWEKQTVYAYLGSPFKKMCCLSDGITIMKLHFIKGILLYHYSLILYETLM